MNFLDAYDLTSTPTVPPSAEEPTQSLNEEVNQVVGQLSRFWGGFRKQVRLRICISFTRITDHVRRSRVKPSLRLRRRISERRTHKLRKRSPGSHMSPRQPLRLQLPRTQLPYRRKIQKMPKMRRTLRTIVTIMKRKIVLTNPRLRRANQLSHQLQAPVLSGMLEQLLRTSSNVSRPPSRPTSLPPFRTSRINYPTHSNNRVQSILHSYGRL